MSVAKTAARKIEPQGRGNVWLGILAIVQAAVLVFVVFTVARPPSTKTGPLLGKGIQVSDITAFTVTGSDGSSVTVKRNGTQWVLPDEGGYPAQTSRVKSFLQELVGLQRSGLVATTKDAYKRLKVTSDTFQRKVALTLSGGKTETLYIGSEPSYGSTHVRLASDKGVYVTHSLHATDARTDAAGYVDATALSLKEGTVTRLEVKNANGDFVFTKGKSGWAMQGVPSGKTFNTNSINAMLSNLTNLQLDEPLGKTAKPAYGFDKPLAVVTLTTVSTQASSGASGAGAAKGGASAGKASNANGAAAGAANTASSTSTATSSATKAATSTTKATTTSTSQAAASASKATSTKATSTKAASSTTSSSSAKAAPAKTVTKTTTITVGAKDKAGFYPVRISSSPFIVRVSASNLGDVVAKKASDFYVKPKASGSNGAGNGAGAAGGLQRLGATPGPNAGGAPTGQ